MTADPPRPPASFGPSHVAERETLRAASPPPPPRPSPTPELFGEGKDADAGARMVGLPLPEPDAERHLEAAGVGLDVAVARVAELERQLAAARREAGSIAANAVGEFIAGHARRLAEAADEPWADLDGEGQSTWMAEVHHVLNNLVVVDELIVDGRPGRNRGANPGLAAILRGLAGNLSATRAAVARPVAQRLRELAAELTPAPLPAPDGVPATIDDVHAAQEAVAAGAVLPVDEDAPSLARQEHHAAELGAVTFPPETAVGALRLYLATVEHDHGAIGRGAAPPSRHRMHARDLLLGNLRADLNEILGVKAAGIELRMILTDGTRTVARHPDDWHLTRDGVRSDTEGLRLLGTIGNQLLRKSDERKALQRIARWTPPPGWHDAGSDRDPKPDNVVHPDEHAHKVGAVAEEVREATGGALDAIGCGLGVFRPDGETDADYRPRLLRALPQPVLRLDMNDSRTYPPGVIPQWCTQADIAAMAVARKCGGEVAPKAEIAKLEAALDKAKVRPLDEVHRLACEIRLARLTGDRRKADRVLEVLDVVTRRLTEAG